MKKQLILFFSLLLFIPLYGYAEDEVNQQVTQQTFRVRGTVTDEQGQPLIGASVAVKGTTQGVITDLKGQFSIETTQNATLTVSYVGYTPVEVPVKGQPSLKITLKEDSKIIDEVVVTALGIKRERKALGYSLGEVKGEELAKAKETNVINSLAGKIPGLVVSQTAGGPSGSSRVIVRGSTEMTGNNQPLYVVDGVPLDNTNYGNAGTYDRGVLESMVKKAMDRAEKLGLQLHCGEFGCYSKTPRPDKINWMQDIVSIFRDNDIAYSYWDYKGGFGICNSQGVVTDQEVLNILTK